MKIAIIGAGSWGTALSNLLATKGYSVGLWAYEAEEAATINETHHNLYYFNDTELPSSVVATNSYEEALDDAVCAVVVTPSAVLRHTAQSMKPFADDLLPVIICSKGVEAETGALPNEIFAEELGKPERIAVLSGPNHAEEVIKLLPCATVIASTSHGTAAFFQEVFATDVFRTYISDDPKGAELCAAFKNVIAIAVGISYGMGFGDNTAAVLITRGLAEMGRLVVACGGQALTCMGLAGAGDMVVTCMSQHSRNRRFGESLAAGKTLDQFMAETHMVVEGAVACKTLQTLADRYQVELPLCETVRAVVWEGLDLQKVPEMLLGRPLVTEFHDLDLSAL